MHTDTSSTGLQNDKVVAKRIIKDSSTPQVEKGDKQQKGSQRTRKRDRLQLESKERKKAAKIEKPAQNSEDVENENGDKGEARAEVQPAEPEEDVLQRTIFVGNLPQGTESKDLKSIFKKCVTPWNALSM